MASYSYTLSNLIIEARELLREETASFWSDAMLTVYINDAISILAAVTGCYRTIQSVNTSNGARTVGFTGYKCIAVEYLGRSLIKIKPEQAGHTKLDGATPQYWYECGVSIGIDPVPNGVYALSLYVTSEPSVLTSGSHTPAIPYMLCNCLKFYVVGRAFEQDRKRAIADMYYSMFFNDIGFLSKAVILNSL